MLIIPYQTRFTAKSLPLVTLALVAINLLVYIVLQAGDNKAYARAADYYFSVQLPQVELPRYAAHLERRGDRRAMQVLSVIRSGPSDEEARAVLMHMQRDRQFMNEMKAGRVVRSDEPGYAAWREQRDRFQGLMSQVFVERFALEPGSADQVRDAVAAMERATRKEAGCLKNAFSVDISDPGMIRVIERWESMEAIQTHMKSPHMADFQNAIMTLQPKGLDIKAFEVAREVQLG